MDQNQSPDREFKAGMLDPTVPKLYANAFAISITSGDIVLLLKRNDTTVGLVNLSYSVAKTIGQKISFGIAELEKLTGNQIMTVDDIGRAMQVDAKPELTK